MLVRHVLENKGAVVATVPTAATLTDVARLLAQHGVGALVVSDDGETIAGIVSERDLARAVAVSGADALELPVTDAMTAEVRTCLPDDTVDSLMETMTSRRIRHLPVTVDERLVGIVSIGDVVKHRLAELQNESRVLHDYLYSGR
ncbi:MAG TPA: CBS domain-containing protein [Acidimicrobiales bacterium]|nr:CBS domain-containing protein [Acidimicrobiales bacterium]